MTPGKRHSHKEWLKFLRLIDVSSPSEKQLHLIVGNYATHKHPAVKRWLSRHPRFHMHFTPTSGSWLNMVERFFRDIGENAIRRSAFQSVDQLITAIHAYLEAHNVSPKPFIWTAKANDILEKGQARPRRNARNYPLVSRTTLVRALAAAVNCCGFVAYDESVARVPIDPDGVRARRQRGNSTSRDRSAAKRETGSSVAVGH